MELLLKNIILLISFSTVSSLSVPLQTRQMINPTTTVIQGNSLCTWSFQSSTVKQVQVDLSTEGRPVDADIELWHGPNNTPCKMRVYVDNGEIRPFSAIIGTPYTPNTVAIRNIGQIEFPIIASVTDKNIIGPSYECVSGLKTIQGGALSTYSFDLSK